MIILKNTGYAVQQNALNRRIEYLFLQKDKRNNCFYPPLNKKVL